MKIINKNNKNTSVVFTKLNGHVDNQGNIQTNNKIDDWNPVSIHEGVDHLMKTNRYNNLKVKHRFVNKTNEEVKYKWSINIVTTDGQNLKYDFGFVTIKPYATQFRNSVPYKTSQLNSNVNVSRIMVAFMIV